MEEILQVKEGEDFASVDKVQEGNRAVGEILSLLTKYKQALRHELNASCCCYLSSRLEDSSTNGSRFDPS